MANDFSVLLLRQDGKQVSAALERATVDQLPPGEVLVRVSHSGLNYKDGMILQGQGRLVRTYPHVPGIDFAGIVEESSDSRWQPGDAVVLTGWRVGEVQWGGYAQRARVRADWLVPLPAGMTAQQAMAVGTAGFTSMLAVLALEEHGLAAAGEASRPAAGEASRPGAGEAGRPGAEVLVTGAAGGVGSVAVAVLARRGYRVVASSGRPEQAEYLARLGAAEVVDRATLAGPPSRPLDAERWAGVVDAVGGSTLATVLTQMRYRGSVAACGLAGGSDLPTTVIPFLLRGVNLLGIDSVMCPAERRREAWARLGTDLDLALLDSMTTVIGLGELPEYGPRILAGQTRGRVVVDVNA